PPRSPDVPPATGGATAPVSFAVLVFFSGRASLDRRDNRGQVVRRAVRPLQSSTRGACGISRTAPPSWDGPGDAQPRGEGAAGGPYPFPVGGADRPGPGPQAAPAPDPLRAP